MHSPSFDEIYMELAQNLARKSHCVKIKVGAVLTTLQLIKGVVAPVAGVTNFGFELQIILWLWFTILFANFAVNSIIGNSKSVS